MIGISVFEEGSIEYEKLMAVALALKLRSPNGWNYVVEETYFDLGRDVKWTTVICKNRRGSGYQALYAAQQEKVILANTLEEIAGIAEEVLNAKWCPDKVA